MQFRRIISNRQTDGATLSQRPWSLQVNIFGENQPHILYSPKSDASVSVCNAYSILNWFYCTLRILVTAFFSFDRSRHCHIKDENKDKHIRFYEGLLWIYLPWDRSIFLFDGFSQLEWFWSHHIMRNESVSEAHWISLWIKYTNILYSDSFDQTNGIENWHYRTDIVPWTNLSFFSPRIRCIFSIFAWHFQTELLLMGTFFYLLNA